MNFDVRNIREWVSFDCGNALTLEAEEGRVQSHRLEVICSEETEVYATDDLDVPKLIGFSIGGKLRMNFTAQGPVAIDFNGNGVVFVRRPLRAPQVIPASDLPSFTTIEPRPSGPSADLRRMMHMVRMNSERREQLLRDEIARLADRVGQTERRSATPAAAPAAAPQTGEPSPAAPAGTPA